MIEHDAKMESHGSEAMCTKNAEGLAINFCMASGEEDYYYHTSCYLILSDKIFKIKNKAHALYVSFILFP